MSDILNRTSESRQLRTLMSRPKPSMATNTNFKEARNKGHLSMHHSHSVTAWFAKNVSTFVDDARRRTLVDSGGTHG